MKAFSSYRLRPLGRLALPAGLVAVLGLSGCYTQLATRGYAAVEAPAAQSSSPMGDSLASDPALAQGGAPAADTLAPKTGAPAVIVNNYYDAGPTYRGYAQWEWDYPLLSVGYYSSRFDRFSRPWWWDDPWYSHRRHHHHHHSYSRPIVVRPQAPAGPYKSETRLYNPDPSYAPVRKGRRAPEPAAQPAQAQEPRQEAQPAPKSSSSSSGSSSSGSGSQSSQDDSKRDDSHPTLKKGRRR